MTRIEKAIGYKFRKKKLLKAALTHPSYPMETVGQRKQPSETFQRLEFLGDAILNFFIARKLYELFPKANEGLLSRLRSTLVSRKLLARIARTFRLKSYLLMSKRKEMRPDLMHEKIVADTFEALIAALYFDRGQKVVEQFLIKRFRPYFNEKKLFQLDPNPKSTLQEYTQKKFGTLPVYQACWNKKSQSFTARVIIKRRLKAKGMGRTKQEAETQAAQALLKKLRIRRKISSAKESFRED